MPTTIRVNIDDPAVKSLLNAPEQAVGRHMLKKAKLIQAAAKRQVGYRTGRLQRSIRIYSHQRHTQGQSIFIGSSVPYALLHHEGTRRHRIEARNKSYLRFRSGTKIVFRKSVNHPGTKPNRYLTDNLYLLGS
jgi:hypothetical protein